MRSNYSREHVDVALEILEHNVRTLGKARKDYTEGICERGVLETAVSVADVSLRAAREIVTDYHVRTTGRREI